MNKFEIIRTTIALIIFFVAIGFIINSFVTCEGLTLDSRVVAIVQMFNDEWCQDGSIL